MAASQKRFVVGYYQSNELLADKDLSPSARRFADRVASLVESQAPVAVVLDATALRDALMARETAPKAPEASGSSGSGAAISPALFVPFVRESKVWVRSAPLPAFEGSSDAVSGAAGAGQLLDALAALVEDGRHRRLVDFEDHLDDLALDWLNPLLLK